jgi:hypothetical protein
MLRLAPFTAIAVALLSTTPVVLTAAALGGCKSSKHARVSSFTPPPLPAGFGERTGAGWRIAVPATWTDQKTPAAAAAWAVADPQAVDDFHANVNVVTEPFTEDSHEYARANEATLRQEPRVGVDLVREDVVDGDPTLILEARWTPVQPSTVPYRTMQSVLASRGTGYVVTCAVSSSAFERYRSTCESIVHSFAVER